MSKLHTSEEICEALVRHVEVMGSEIFEKNFVKDGKVVCSVWCIVGPNAQAFRDSVATWLYKNGFKDD
jgi:hypothetical protein